MARTRSKDGEIYKGLTWNEHRSERFDYYCSVRDVFTHSFNDFLISVVSSGSRVDAGLVENIQAHGSTTDDIPFLSPDEIESACRYAHASIGYESGAVSLEAICEWQRRMGGLNVVTTPVRTPDEAEREVLGRIIFYPPVITVFADYTNSRRQRFTLAHELGHLLLGHGKYMRSESVDAADVDVERASEPEADDILRLEWQANYFASCLLLPREQIIASAYEQARLLDLRDRGHGLIYLDHQPVNTQSYYLLTSALMQEFSASRTAVKIRLKTLGLLNDSSSWRGLTL